MTQLRAEVATVGLAEAPRVVGIDDWALVHSWRFGAMVVDLQRRRPIELLGRGGRRLAHKLPRQVAAQAPDLDGLLAGSAAGSAGQTTTRGESSPTWQAA